MKSEHTIMQPWQSGSEARQGQEKTDERSLTFEIVHTLAVEYTGFDFDSSRIA